MARAVQSLSDTVQSKPSFHETQCLAACTQLAEVAFHSCKELCTTMGIESAADMKTFVRRRKGGGKERTVHEAILLLGFYIADEIDENSAAAMLVGKCVPYVRRYETVDSLVRMIREFDLRSMSYTHPLPKSSLQAVHLVMNVFAARLSATPSEVSEVQAVDTVFSQLKTFSMRWCPMLQPSSRA